MRSIIILFMLLFIGNITLAQKVTSSDTTQKKIQKASVSNKNVNKKEQETQEVHITPGSSGVKRSIGYRFSALREDSDPGDGIFRYNNGTVTKITYIFVDNKDISGEDQTNWYSTWDDTTGATGRGQLILADNDGKNVNIFNVTGAFIDGKGFRKIPVEYVSGALPADGSVYYYVFNRIARRVASGGANQDNKVTQGNQGNRPEQTKQTTQVTQETQVVQSIQTKPVAQVNQGAQTAQETRVVQNTQTKPVAQVNQGAQTAQETRVVQNTQTKPVAQVNQGTQAAQETRVVQNTQTKPVAQVNQGTQVIQGGQPAVTQYNYQPQSVKRRKWYSGIIEIGYALGVGDYGVNNFRFNFINGIKIGKYSSIGLGIGVRRYFKITGNHPDLYLVSSKEQIPVFLDLRTTFSAKKLTPYLALGIGNSAGYDSTETRHEGIFFSTSGGIWYNVSDRFAVFAGIAYEMQKLEFSNTDPYTNNYKKNASSLSLNIGISF